MHPVKTRLVILFMLSCFLVTSNQTTIDVSNAWSSFKALYGKSYSPEEEPMRTALFEQDVASVIRYNIEADLGLRSDTQKVYEWSDLTEKEREELFSCYFQSSASEANFHYNATQTIPMNLDYRKLGMVTSVKYQGTCGACYVFSALGALEGQWAKMTGSLDSLSVQNYLDCSSYRRGCNGGTESWVYDYVISNRGIDTEIFYPYEGKDGTTRSCKYRRSGFGASCDSYRTLTKDDEHNLQMTVYLDGPVSVGINMRTMVHYRSGVHDPENCDPRSLNHAVVVIGYGVDMRSGMEYWLGKNSWGTWWGNKGYFKLRRNSNNACGIASDAIIPVV